MGIIREEDMKVFDDPEKRGFLLAVSSGDVELAESELKKNQDLAKIKMKNGMLPIHIAASCGQREMLQRLFRQTYLDLEWEQKVQLLFTTIKNNMYEEALEMLREDPRLVDSRDEKQLTVLHVLAGKQSDDYGPGSYDTLDEWDVIWPLLNTIVLKERNEMQELVTKPSSVLFEAAKSGKSEIIRKLLEYNRELLMVLDSERRSLLHVSVLYRQAGVFSLLKKEMWRNLAMQMVDVDGNNILHMAGTRSPHERFESSRPDIQMQEELSWFKKVEKMVPATFNSMRNNEGQTPKDIFYSTHRDLIDRAKKEVKARANYGMLVATIIATIVFAASLTVPGHDVSPEANSLILQKKGWYIVFILSDALALFSSSLSTIIFLVVLTFSYTEDEFNISLLLRLTSGVGAVFVAITAMMVTFTAACFLIFNHHSTWVAYVVASLGFLTVALFSLLLYTLFHHELIDFMSLSKFRRHRSRRKTIK